MSYWGIYKVRKSRKLGQGVEVRAHYPNMSIQRWNLKDQTDLVAPIARLIGFHKKSAIFFHTLLNHIKKCVFFLALVPSTFSH